MTDDYNYEVHPRGGPLERAKIIPKTDAQIDAVLEQARKAFPEQSEIPDDVLKAMMHAEVNVETWRNAFYMIMVYRGRECDELVHQEEFKGKCIWLSIKRRDKKPVNHWQDMQTIKNHLAGPDREAIQIFPAESRVVNTSNQYHLMVMPEGAKIPFGWDRRAVVEKDTDGDGAHQTFRGEKAK